MTSQTAPVDETKQEAAARKRTWRKRSFILRSLIFCASFIALTIYFFVAFDVTEKLSTYQGRWHPALAFACTGKMGVISLEDVSPSQRKTAQEKISEFLKRGGVQSYDCADLPLETKILPFTAESNHQRFFHRFQVGLYTLTGLLWMVTGPTWSAVGLLSSSFAAGAMIALYYSTRRFAGVVPALAIVALLGSSPFHTPMIPATRDYTKTFFVFTTFAYLLWLITNRFASQRAYIAACLILGVLTGVGVSFRQDMLTTSILAGAIIALLPPALGQGAAWRASLGGTAVFALGVALCIVPLYSFVPIDHGNEGHFMILGLSRSALQGVGLDTGVFVLNPIYRDTAGAGIIQSWVMAYTGAEKVAAFSKEYNTLSRLAFLDYAITFPQFVLGRIYMIAGDITTSWSLLGHKTPMLSRLHALNSILALISAYFHNKRVFSFLVAFFFGMSAILSLQYLPRHYFHIHLLWISVAGSLSIFGVIQFLQRKTDLQPLGRWISYLANPAAAGYPKAVAGWLIPFLFVGAASGILAIQAWSIYTPSAWENVVLSQPVQDASYTVETETGDRALVRLDPSASFPTFAGRELTFEDARTYPRNTLTGGYLEMRFASRRVCSRSSVVSKLTYSAWRRQADLSHQFLVKLDEERITSRFLPVYFSSGLELEAISFSHEDVKCLLSVHWVQNFPRIRLPVEFTATR